jgi:hypothetical protein
MSDTFSVDLSGYGHDERQGDGYTRIQWVNGDKNTFTSTAKQRKIEPVPGHFFVSADNLPEGVEPSAPWIEWTETFRSGEVQGYRADRVQMVIIAQRQQPYAQVGDRKEWLERWDSTRQGIRMHADIMMLVEGLEMLGPVVLSTNSTLVSLAFTGAARGGRAPGIIAAIQTELVDVANRVAKRIKLNPAAFWVSVGGEVDAKGQPVFTQTQGQPVTRPAIFLPAAADDGAKVKRAVKAYVGNEVLENDIIPALQNAEPWRKLRFGNDVAEEAATATAQPRRNQPQALDDVADLEF